MGTHQFLQISHGNLLILVKGLRLCGLQFPCDSESALPREPPGVGNLRYLRLWALVVALLFQLSSCWYSRAFCMFASVPGAWGPWCWSLWLASSPRAGLCVAVSHTPGSTCLMCSPAPIWMPSPAPFLWAPANRKSAGLTFIFAVCVWLPARRCFWLCGRHWLDHRT